ncbi:MAG: addiction module protein [Bryobacteraceae bacterium]|nr:addiction module protein [Bryobacteraceae bacterium]
MAKVDLRDILELSDEERIAVAQEIWDSVAEDPNSIPLTPEQRAELERRLNEHNESTDDVVSWDDVQSKLRSPLGS